MLSAEGGIGSWPPQDLAVVIGAGGMSLAIARRIGQRYRVVLADMDSGRLERGAVGLRAEGIAVEPIACDVTKPDSVAGLAARVGALGPLSALVHVAGLSPGMADWRTIMSVNLIGPALVTEALAPLVRPGSCTVLIASLAAHMAKPEEELLILLDNPLRADFLDRLDMATQGTMTSQMSYVLSKLALIRLGKRLAISWGPTRSRVVSLSPGLIASPQGIREFQHSPTKYERVKQCPLQRQGSMQEICDVVEFLLSSKASFINGTDILVDGGIHAAWALSKAD